MSTGENNPEHIQPYESYTVDMLRDFADEIIRHHCDDTAALTGTDRASWDSPDASVYILKRVGAHGPNYHFNVKDNTQLSTEFVYLISARYDKVVSLDNDNNPLDDSPIDNMKQLMGFLRTQNEVPEPRLDQSGKDIFESMAAHTAVQSAIENHQVDIPWLATAHNAIGATETFEIAVDASVTQGIKVKETTVPFTSSRERIRDELSGCIIRYNQSFMSSPSASDSDSGKSQ